MGLYKHIGVILTIHQNIHLHFNLASTTKVSNLNTILRLTMYLMFIFLISTVLGMNDLALTGEEISRIQYHLVNEFDEPSGSRSNGRKRHWGTPCMLFCLEYFNSLYNVCQKLVPI